ncbi:MAG: hypothetical protein GY768_27640 [Planctomycetaceae bacterium]|nr:hypothetical protein [Planctomycetaceae bacterium]
MDKTHLTLRASESVVAAAAANIYSAYIVAGLVREGSESDWIDRAVKESIQIAKRSDELVVSDSEMS